LIASGRAVKNPWIVIQFAAARTLHDDAPIHATSGHPTAVAAAQLVRRMIDNAHVGELKGGERSARETKTATRWSVTANC